MKKRIKLENTIKQLNKFIIISLKGCWQTNTRYKMLFIIKKLNVFKIIYFFKKSARLENLNKFTGIDLWQKYKKSHQVNKRKVRILN